MLPRLLIAFSLLTLSTHAADWPQFRGPHASGVDTNKALPTEWNVESGKNVRWQTPLPGLGHASPIISGDRLYVATAVGASDKELKVGLYGSIEPINETGSYQWRLLALNRASGKIIWNTLGLEATPRVKRHPKSTHCNSTPATDGKRIVTLFGSEGLFCFDTDGKLLWKKDLGPLDSGYYVVPSAQWGFASSPVIHDGKVIVLCDVQKNSFLAVFNLADGKELWLLNGGGDIPVPTPIFANNLIYLTSAHGNLRPMRAIRPNATGDITAPKPGDTNAAIAWVHPRQGNYMQTPIAIGNRLYGCTDNGVVTCFDATSGKIIYSERLEGPAQGYTASPVSDGRHIYFPGETGKVLVIPAKDEFAVTSINDLSDLCMASPAIADGTLFFRTQSKLIAIGAK